jgi:hypothetical protein
MTAVKGRRILRFRWTEGTVFWSSESSQPTERRREYGTLGEVRGPNGRVPSENGPNTDVWRKCATGLPRLSSQRGAAMKDGAPDIIAINNDDYHAEHIGRTADGRQFILTTPFEPTVGGREGAEYVARYLFDSKGKLLEANIEDFGPRATLDDNKRRKTYDRLLAELGDVILDRVEVAPFSVERFGTTFGLVVREPDEDDGVWAVEMQPGNYMAFFEPWDSGDYDT